MLLLYTEEEEANIITSTLTIPDRCSGPHKGMKGKGTQLEQGAHTHQRSEPERFADRIWY